MSSKGKHFSIQYPEVNEALNHLRQACEKGQHFDEKISMLLKLAVAVGAGLENTVKAHAAKALRLGLTEDQIEEVVLINLPSIGYAKSVSALNWIHAVTGKSLFQ